MAMNIKSEEAHRLAIEIAQRTGTTLTEAVTEALRLRQRQLERESERDDVDQILLEIRKDLAGEPVPDIDALLYDAETGLPK